MFSNNFLISERVNKSRYCYMIIMLYFVDFKREYIFFFIYFGKMILNGKYGDRYVILLRYDEVNFQVTGVNKKKHLRIRKNFTFFFAVWKLRMRIFSSIQKKNVLVAMNHFREFVLSRYWLWMGIIRCKHNKVIIIIYYLKY